MDSDVERENGNNKKIFTDSGLKKKWYIFISNNFIINKYIKKLYFFIKFFIYIILNCITLFILDKDISSIICIISRTMK